MVKDKILELKHHYEMTLGQIAKIIEVSPSNYMNLVHEWEQLILYTTPKTTSISIGKQKFAGMDVVSNSVIKDDEILFISENATRLYKVTHTPKYDKFLDKLAEIE